MAGNRTLKLSILADTDDLVKGLKKAENETGNSGNRIGDTFKKVGAAAAAAGIAAAAFAVKLGIDATKAASDFSETLAKTNVLFGEGSIAVQKFADTAAAQFGQSKQQALDASATFATFGRAAGLAGEELVTFSTDFVGLASDLASFNNTTPEQAINAIGSALRGEAEPLRQFGVLLDDATLRNAALELGLISTTKNALTPQQKVLAAQKVIYEQTSAAQGDFARTSDGLANQQRILTAELENTKIEIGEQLLPVAVDLFRFFNESLVPIIRTELVPRVKDFIQSLKDTSVEIKNYSIKNVDALKESFKELTIRLGFAADATREQNDVAVLLKNVFKEISLATLNAPIVFFRAILELINLIIKSMQALVLIVQGDLRAAFRVFAEDNKVVTKGLEDQYRALNNVNDGLANQYRQLVLLSQAPTGGGGGGGSFLPTFTPGAGGAGTGGAATVPTIRGLSSSQIQTLKDDLGLISQFGGVIEGLNEKFGDPFFGFGKGFNVAESIRTGIPVTNRNPRTTPTVNVNVTGNLIDPAGAARAIAEVIKNEGARNGNLPLVSEFIAQ
jgi:hypothetical protein